MRYGETIRAALIALSPKRVSTLPNVPTVRESGFNFDVSIWSGLFAPKGLPADISKRLSDVLKDALSDAAIKDFEEKTGILHGFIDAKSSRAQMDSEAAGLQPVMQNLNLIKAK